MLALCCVWQDCQDGPSLRQHQHTCQSLQHRNEFHSFIHFLFSLVLLEEPFTFPLHLSVLVCQKMRVRLHAVSEAEGVRLDSVMDRELRTSHIVARVFVVRTNTSRTVCRFPPSLHRPAWQKTNMAADGGGKKLQFGEAKTKQKPWS